MKISITENKKPLIKPYQLKRRQLAKVTNSSFFYSGHIVYRVTNNLLMDLTTADYWDQIIKAEEETEMLLEVLTKEEIVTLQNEE